MRKEDYKDYLDPEDFAETYRKWAEAGKPTGNSPLYILIWEGVENAVKACIGKMQKMYGVTVSSYEDKVLDSSIKVVTKLLSLNEPPKNIVTLSWLYTFGVTFGKAAIQQDFENESLSTSEETEGGNTFEDLMYVDEKGNLQIGSWD